MVANLGGEVVGDEFVMLGSKDVKQMIDKIIAVKPDVIFNNINGDSNIEFFKQLRAAGITPDKIPTFSFSVAEDELRSMDIEQMRGDYTAWNYFQSIKSPENQVFVENYRNKYGVAEVTDDPIEAGYISVYLWSQAVKAAGTEEVNEVRKNLANQSFHAPEGLVYIDAATQHTWKTVRIGKFRGYGDVEVVWSSEKPVKPFPYPTTRTRETWDKFLVNLYEGWDKHWAKLSE
jgi:urea transport system substrate-binding protein